MVDLSKLLIPKANFFSDKEKLLIKIVLEYGIDRNSAIRKLQEMFFDNKDMINETEKLFISLQNSIKRKVCCNQIISYKDFVEIVTEINRIDSDS